MHVNGKRDFVGYGKHPPYAQWPGGAKLALNFVVDIARRIDIARHWMSVHPPDRRQSMAGMRTGGSA